jgi:hypothetical protein
MHVAGTDLWVGNARRAYMLAESASGGRSLQVAATAGATAREIDRLFDGGGHLRNRTPASQRFGAFPSYAGLMTRLACERARNAGIDLPRLLRRVGLTVQDIEDESVPLSVAEQIDCLNLLAETLGDRLLGFHVARSGWVNTGIEAGRNIGSRGVCAVRA